MRYEKDPDLSIKAKGILSIIENATNGKTGEIDFNFEMIVGAGGRDSKRNGMKELINAGYLKTELERNGRGQIVGNRYFVKYSKVLERV